MNQKSRIILAMVLLFALVGLILGVNAVQRQRAALQSPADLPPGAIPIYLDRELAASFTPTDLDKLAGASFVDAEEGKTQEGWLLKDVLSLYLDGDTLQPETKIIVTSTSREKSKSLTWAEVQNPENMVLFDVSGRGTLKLTSTITGFDTRDDWIQDVDQIEVQP